MLILTTSYLAQYYYVHFKNEKLRQKKPQLSKF